jgi:iron complex outermembrane receptor protein
LGFYYAGRIPLNDANSFFAEAYRLWQTKFSLLPKRKERGMTWHILVDNIANAKFSLGNDINAFGNRFFNLAPGRSLQAGVSWKL